MDKRKKIHVYQYIAGVLLAVYVIMAAALLVQAADLDMFPFLYLIIIAAVFLILGVAFFLMHRKLTTSIIADVLSLIMIFFCGAGAYYIRQTTDALADVTTMGEQTDVFSVYVMKDDPAEKLEDIKGYEIGVVGNVGGEAPDNADEMDLHGSDNARARDTDGAGGQGADNADFQGTDDTKTQEGNNPDADNTAKTVVRLEDTLDSTLDISGYGDMFALMDALRAGQIGAVILNEAYVGIISEREGYEWVATDIRQLTAVEHVTKPDIQPIVPEVLPETFIMYLSGIDTYGGVSARSRSDVNILAIVNTKTKNVLLLSTPRDYYVSFNATGGARDKLTHAGIYGVDASIDALEQLYGIQVDYYLRLNFSGFIDIIDALGGIEVYSDYDFTVTPIRTYQKGINQLSGLEALAFARERYSFPEGDFQRAKNQMEVIRAVIQKCASSSMLVNYASVMEAVSGSFETSMTQEQIASLVKMQLSDMAQWNVTSYTVDGHSTYAETFSMPGTELYVIEPDYATVETAKEMIREIYGDEERYGDESGSE